MKNISTFLVTLAFFGLSMNSFTVSALTNVTYTVSATSSTSVVLIFSMPVTGLTVGHITFSGGLIATATVTGSGTAWTVTTTTQTQGTNYFVSVSNFGTFNVINSSQTFLATPPTPHAITVTNNGNGTAEANTVEAIVGTLITLNATPNTNCVFTEWQVISGNAVILDPTANTTAFTMPDNSVEIKAMFNSTIGLVPTTLNNQLCVYPNPTCDILNFSIETPYEIIDLQGKLLLKSDKAINAVNISSLASGVYFVKLKTETGNFTHKVLKK